jgi:histidyl-tRNA synthetase
MLRAVDKIAKKSKDEIIKEFENRYPKENLEKILEFSQIKGSIKEIESKFDVSQLESWDEIKALFESLENRGVSNVRINFGIVRGLDYYSGIVFEVFDKNSKLGALAGGGRYDTLTKAFKRDDIGATGVAGGVERIILTMQEQNIISEIKQSRVSILYINDEMQKVAHSITSLLRLNNIPTDIDLAGRNLKKQMDIANNSRFTIIVGPQELEQGNVVLKDMKTGTEATISLEKLTDDPKSIFNLETL